MPNLKPSLTGDNYTQDQKKEMWIDIYMGARCPECGAKHSMMEGPYGGLAINTMCSECGMVFWTTGFPGSGAYPLKSGASETDERR